MRRTSPANRHERRESLSRSQYNSAPVRERFPSVARASEGAPPTSAGATRETYPDQQSETKNELCFAQATNESARDVRAAADLQEELVKPRW
jgi:hypothetical protein